MTSRIPYKDPYVVKSQLVEQNDPFLINKIACILSYQGIWWDILRKIVCVNLKMQKMSLIGERHGGAHQAPAVFGFLAIVCNATTTGGSYGPQMTRI